MNDEPLVSELADLTALPLSELITTEDPVTLASLARVRQKVLDRATERTGPCTPDTCGY